MLRWIQGLRLRDYTRNEQIREAATVQPITTHLMQNRLRWHGHVRRRDDSHMTRTVLDMEVEGETQRKTKITIHGHHQKTYKEEWADGSQYS